MKTAIHLPPAQTMDPARHRPVDAWRPTIRLGVVLSTLAALAAAGLRLTTTVPSSMLVLAVGVIGFALSWHATWHPRADDDPPP